MPGLMNHEQQRRHPLGTNVRVCATQGGRKYMEDRVHIHAERTENGDIDFLFFGCYDGHGGAQASQFTRENLMIHIINNQLFRSDNDADVCEAIRLGFLQTHFEMLKVVGTWPRTASGYQSTAGTTASIAFVMNGKLYTGHVGDSAIVLATRSSDGCDINAERLTIDHKPDSPEELRRIERHGGQVLNKAGVMRVVWRRTVRGHEGPIRRSTPQESIPFLAVARSLGDLWSYNADTDEFVVSPEPDTHVHTLTSDDVAIVLASDGLWNVGAQFFIGVLTLVIRDQYSVSIVDAHEWRELDEKQIEPPHLNRSVHANHSRWLVRHALRSWGYMRADNITAITVIFDPLDSELPGTSACVVDNNVRREFVEDVLIEHPDSMLRITPTVTQRLRTAPVELVYNGAMDVMPNGFSIERAYAEFDGPGFSVLKMGSTSSGPPVQRSASTILDAVTTKFTVTKSKSVESRSGIRSSPLPCPAESDGSELEDSSSTTTTTTTKTSSRMESLHELSIVEEEITKTRTSSPASCSPAIKDPAPPTTLIQNVVHAAETKRPTHVSKPRFVCRKHGMDCAKVKRLNAESINSRPEDGKHCEPISVEHEEHPTNAESTTADRNTETPPPPDPKPSIQRAVDDSVVNYLVPKTPVSALCAQKPEPATSARRTRQRMIRPMDDGMHSRYNLRRASKQPNIPDVVGTPGTTDHDKAMMCRSAPAKQHHSHYLRSVDNQHDGQRNTPVARKRRHTANHQRRRSKEFAENIESFDDALLDGEISRAVWKCKADRRRSGAQRNQVNDMRPQSANQMRPDNIDRWCGCEAAREDCECMQITSQYNSVFARLNLHSTACTKLTSVCRQVTAVSASEDGHIRTNSYSRSLTSAVFARAPRPSRKLVTSDMSPVQAGTKRKLFDVSSKRGGLSDVTSKGTSASSEPAAKRSRLWNFFGLFGSERK